MTDQDHQSARRTAIGHLVFNNPEKRNAVSLDMWQAVEEVLEEFAGDDGIRVVVLSGAGGKAFVSGADISKFEDERAGAEAVAHYNATTARIYGKLQRVSRSRRSRRSRAAASAAAWRSRCAAISGSAGRARALRSRRRSSVWATASPGWSGWSI